MRCYLNRLRCRINESKLIISTHIWESCCFGTLHCWLICRKSFHKIECNGQKYSRMTPEVHIFYLTGRCHYLLPKGRGGVNSLICIFDIRGGGGGWNCRVLGTEIKIQRCWTFMRLWWLLLTGSRHILTSELCRTDQYHYYGIRIFSILYVYPAFKGTCWQSRLLYDRAWFVTENNLGQRHTSCMSLLRVRTPALNNIML